MDEVKHPVAKLVSVPLALIAGLSWGEIASMMSAIYVGLLILDLLWKRVGKPLARNKWPGVNWDNDTIK